MSLFSSILHLRREMAAPRLHREILRALLDREYPDRFAPRGTEFGGRHNAFACPVEYRTVGGDRLRAGTLLEFREGPYLGNFGIQHCDTAAIPVLLRDAWERAERADWAGAVRAYFLALPFERGTAAIGHSFWAGVLSARVGRKRRLPDGADLRAFALGAEAFESWLTASWDDGSPTAIRTDSSADRPVVAP
jgi:hypothetical protein